MPKKFFSISQENATKLPESDIKHRQYLMIAFFKDIKKNIFSVKNFIKYSGIVSSWHGVFIENIYPLWTLSLSFSHAIVREINVFDFITIIVWDWKKNE